VEIVRKTEWEQSYSRQENYIFYPKEEVVKFLNRFIRKRTGTNQFKDILIQAENLRGLDLGCGIGRQTILLEEFNIEGYGVDISSNALEEAKQLSEFMGFDLKDRFRLLDTTQLPFEDNYFDFAISDSVLDSMDFELARDYIFELDRTVKQYVYLNLISSESVGHGKTGDFRVETEHEKGTIQSYYSEERIRKLVEQTRFEVVFLQKNREQNLLDIHTRFHVVLKRTK